MNFDSRHVARRRAAARRPQRNFAKPRRKLGGKHGLHGIHLFGRHALAGYIVHDLAGGAVKPFVPKDSPLWWVMIAFAVYLLLITVVLRYLDRNRLFLKL